MVTLAEVTVDSVAVEEAAVAAEVAVVAVEVDEARRLMTRDPR